MPTIKEIAEKVVRLNEGSVSSDESRLDELYTYSVINQARAYVLRQDFLKYKRWSPSALQEFYPDYDATFQNSVCYTRFQLPTGFIQGNSAGDGLVYFGSSSEKVLTTTNFYRIQNRAYLSDFLNNEWMSPAAGRYNGVLIEGDLVTIISKDNIKIKYPLVVAVFDDPTAIPTFNKIVDQYPISGDLEQQMYEIIENGTMKYAYAKLPDSISNTQIPLPTK